MSQQRRDEFKARVKAAHDAIDAYADCRLRGSNDWFIQGLDGKARHAVEDLLRLHREEVVSVSVPLPSAVALEDNEIIRSYVDSEIRTKIEEWFDQT